MFQLIRWGLVLSWCAVLAVPAFAFTPNDGELAQKMRHNYGPLASWEAEMAFPDYPGVSVHLWFARGKWRQEWSAGDKAVAVGFQGRVAAHCTAGDFPSSPLFVWMVPDPVAVWKSWGVDNATGGFGFCGESPCYMFGAEDAGSAAPAVFLHNESLAPLLLRFGSGDGLTVVEYGDYKTVGGFEVPRSVSVTRNGRTLRATVAWIAVNRADAEEFYDRNAPGGEPCADPPEPFAILRDLFRYPAAR
ncbi:MAG: hypothetical protein V3571_12675 [Pseudodesulfovibrio sp.]